MSSGFTDVAEASMLVSLLSSGTAYQIALLTTLPTDDAATGAVEASGSGYARVTCSSWVTVTTSTNTIRRNSVNITFGALTGALTGIVGWAIYSASGTTMLAYGPIKDVSGNEITKNFIATDQPQFIANELQVGFAEAS